MRRDPHRFLAQRLVSTNASRSIRSGGSHVDQPRLETPRSTTAIESVSVATLFSAAHHPESAPRTILVLGRHSARPDVRLNSLIG
jgi:hypothetical protein